VYLRANVRFLLKLPAISWNMSFRNIITFYLFKFQNNFKTIKMKSNIGTVDRLLRIILGLIIAILGVVFDSWWGLVGIIPIATGLFQFCPLYFPLKISTVKKE
jgi:hypothetical protein